MKIFKFRKGDEKSEFFSIILAVGGILLIGGLGFLLYSSFVNQDLNNAKKFIDGLKGKIENLDDGESSTFAMNGPAGWVLVAWNKDVKIVEDGKAINGTAKPQKCFDKNCLCMCEGSIANCGEIGFCRNIDRNVEVSSRLEEFRRISKNINVKTGTSDDYLYQGNFSANCIYFSGSPILNFLIDKKIDSVFISHDYGLFNYLNSFSKINLPRGSLYNTLVGYNGVGVLFQCIHKDDRKSEKITP